MSDYSKKTYNEMEKKDKERWEQATSKHRIHEVREKKERLRKVVQHAEEKLQQVKRNLIKNQTKKGKLEKDLKKASAKEEAHIHQHTQTARMLSRQKGNAATRIASLQLNVSEMEAAIDSATKAKEILPIKYEQISGKNNIETKAKIESTDETDKKDDNDDNESETKSKNTSNDNERDQKTNTTDATIEAKTEEATTDTEDELQEDQEDEKTVCVICFDSVDTSSSRPDRSTSTLSCGHSFHLTCIGKKFNTAGGNMQCPMRCDQLETIQTDSTQYDNTWGLSSDAHLVGIVFNVIRKLMKDNLKKGIKIKDHDPYETIFAATNKMGFSKKMVRGALGTLARGYITRKGNSVILTEGTSNVPLLAGSALSDEGDDGQPKKT